MAPCSLVSLGALVTRAASCLRPCVVPARICSMTSRRQPGADRGQPRLDLAGRLVGADGDGLLRQHVAGVQRHRHADDGDAGLRFAAEDGPGDRRRPTVFRQQRAVDVDAALRRHGQHVARQDLAVGGDDEQVGPPFAELGDPFRRVNALGLEDGDAVGQGDFLHAAAGLARGTADGAAVAVGLRDQADDRIGAGQQGVERRLGEEAGPHHDDAHGRPPRDAFRRSLPGPSASFRSRRRAGCRRAPGRGRSRARSP